MRHRRKRIDSVVMQAVGMLAAVGLIVGFVVWVILSMQQPIGPESTDVTSPDFKKEHTIR